MNIKYIIGAACLTVGFTFTACSDDDDYKAYSGNILSTVQTGDAAVTATTATTLGTVIDLSGYASSSYEVGAVYATTNTPATTGKRQAGAIAEDGTVTTTLTGLTKGQTYYYATYVTLQGKVTQYGEVKSFYTTDADIASTTGDVTATKATLNATVSQTADVINAGASEIEYGFKVAADEEGVTDGIDYPAAGEATTFSQQLSGLLPGKTYYYVSYFKIGDGLAYSDVQSFTTKSMEMEYVDLGLTVMWAKYNLGAESETEPGGLYGDGDLTGMKTSEYAAQYATGDIAGTANDLALSVSAAIDGAATKQSMMPTQAQIDELLAATTKEFTEVDGVPGYKLTAKNGNYIFFPAAGYRSGTAVTDEGNAGYYWTGNINPTNADYANTVTFNADNIATGTSARQLGLSVRSVREMEPQATLDVDNSKIIYGDIENNGRFRIEIFNLYGAGTASNPPIDVNKLKFQKNMVIKFNIEGLPEDGVDCYGGLEYADESWGPALWSNFDCKYDCHVTKNGTYTVWMEVDEQAEGAAVFCIDIDGMHTQLGDAISNVKAAIESISFDVDDSAIQYYVDNNLVQFNNKDGNGEDGRIEIYNEWGSTKGAGADYSDLKFKNSYMIVNFTISGIDGNLVSGSTGSYKTELSFADQGWGCQYWGGFEPAATAVTGDGTYEVWAPLSGDATPGPCVWTIEIYGLWKELVDTSKVKVTINSVIVPGKE